MSARKDKAAGEIARVAGWALLLSGVAILGTDCVEWLQTGAWRLLRIGQAIAWLGGREPSLSQWQGAQQIVRWVFDQTLGGAVVIVGLLLAALGAATADEADRRAHIERADY